VHGRPDGGFGGWGGEKIHEEKPVNYSNILIRVPNWLGDTMMATPAVSAVREMFPKSRLTILCKPNYTGFWENYPGVQKVITLRKGFFGFWETAGDIRQEPFDAALVLPGSFSSAFLVFAAGVPERIGWGGEGRDFFLTRVVSNPRPRQKHLVKEYLDLVREGLGQSPRSKSFRLLSPVTPAAKLEVKRIYQDAEVRDRAGLVAMVPGAAYGEAKRWPLPYWRELIGKFLAARKESILILGGIEEEAYLKNLEEGLSPEMKERVHWMVGKTTPLALGGILSRCKLLITNDTGPMHVAAAVGTQTVALFGSTSPTWTRPFGTGHEVIYHQVECSPCFQKSCPIGYLCLHKISVEEVFQAARRKLKNPVRVGAEQI
jgi:heptosyltransferase II